MSEGEVFLGPFPRPGPVTSEKVVIRILDPQIVAMPGSRAAGIRFTLELWFTTPENDYGIQVEGCLACVDELGRLTWSTPKTAVRGYPRFRLVSVSESIYLAVLDILMKSSLSKIVYKSVRAAGRKMARDLGDFQLLEENSHESAS